MGPSRAQYSVGQSGSSRAAHSSAEPGTPSHLFRRSRAQVVLRMSPAPLCHGDDSVPWHHQRTGEYCSGSALPALPVPGTGAPHNQGLPRTLFARTAPAQYLGTASPYFDPDKPRPRSRDLVCKRPGACCQRTIGFAELHRCAAARSVPAASASGAEGRSHLRSGQPGA